MKNQVRLSEATLEINQNISQKLDERSRRTIEDLRRLEDELAHNEIREYFQGITQLINGMIERQQRAVNKIKAVLRESATGAIPEMIPLSLVEQDIQQIQETLPTENALPTYINNEPASKILMYAKISRTSKYDEKLLIEVTIPIVARMKFNLFKTTPIPFEINGFTMIVHPQAKYFLLDGDETRYIPLNDIAI